ncbi:MAG: signal peptidase I [Anaerolineales bacterium]|nr:signal peptidase I [Anaerolineales bacterium]
MNRRFAPNILSAFWIIVMIMTWSAFAPRQVGGLASYVIIVGSSMEPNFHIGDLVIAHREPNYEAGDAVVYMNREVGQFIFHRIIAEETGRFLLKGDNNPWTDTYRPTGDEVLGRLWLHIPRGGSSLLQLRNPAALSLIVGLLAILLLTPVSSQSLKGKKRMNRKTSQEPLSAIRRKMAVWLTHARATSLPTLPNRRNNDLIEGVFFGLTIVALGSAVLAILSFSKPPFRVENDPVDFSEIGVFSYSATAPKGVYDSDALKSGDPIFPQLTCSLDVSFQYVLMPQPAQDIAGTHRLTAIVTEPASGWTRRLPLQAETPFSGNTFGTTVPLNVCEIDRLIQSLEREAGFHSASYLVTIVPNVHLKGVLAGRPLETRFDIGLTFRYDRIHFALVRDEGNSDPLNVSQKGILNEERTVANTMLLLGMKAAIPTVRWSALLGLILSLAGLALLTVRVQDLAKSNYAEFVRLRYQSLITEIQKTPAMDSANVIDVASMDDLAKLAEKSGLMILYLKEPVLQTYYVQGAGMMYRFIIPVQMRQPDLAVKAETATKMEITTSQEEQ